MADRPNLQTLLEELLGSRNVYFQPPESLKMNYPAIVYSLDNIENKHANNSVYDSRRRYAVTFITDDPDSRVIGELAYLQMCRFNRHYKSNNLNHYVFELYY